jgi:SAM-dependent methyltransferase
MTSDRPYDRQKLIDWYDERSDEYDRLTYSQTDDRYGGDFFRMQLVAREIDRIAPKSVLDIGCGTAEPMLKILDKGIDARGFDLSPGMIATAKKKLAERGLDPSLAEVGDLLSPDIFERYPKAGFDAVVANGVMPYIANSAAAHRQIVQFVRPGGYLMSAYSNALLDLFTCNRFTAAFITEQLLPAGNVPADVAGEIPGLLTHPDEPRSIPGGARDQIFVRSHNLFEVEKELSTLGLVTERRLFYKFHAFPPLLANTAERRKLLFDLSRRMEIALSGDWRGIFMASTVILVARRAA